MQERWDKVEYNDFLIGRPLPASVEVGGAATVNAYLAARMSLPD